MQSSDKELLRRIEEKLKSKDASQGDIKIRDIMVRNPDGEFISSKNKNESEPHLIQRMSQHVEEMANISKQIHFSDNFNGFAYVLRSDKEPDIENIPPNTLVALYKENQLTIYWIENGKKKEHTFSDTVVSSIVDKLPKVGNKSEDSTLIQDIVLKYGCMKLDAKSPDVLKMKKECEDNITRLSFNEFSFYPHETHGPLTTKGFVEFTKQLELVASGLPENLHLLVASVPVVDDNHDVHNMICYVQCGKNLKIDTFAKAVPSDIDFVYPGTANAYATQGSNIRKLLNNILDFQSLMLDPETRVDVIKKFMNQCFTHPNYKPSNELLKLLNQYIIQLEDMGGNLKNQYPATIRQLKNDWEDIKQEIKIFSKDITARSSESSKMIYQSSYSLPSMTLSNTEATGNQYGGYLIAKSSGGTPFTVSIDICLDHLYGVAKNRFQSNVKLAKESMQPGTIPLQVSSMLSSASIANINPQNIVSDNITHTDSVSFRIGVKPKNNENPTQFKEQEYPLTESSFGDLPTIIINSPITLGILSGETGELIAQHNRFSIKVQALKQLAQQQPRLKKEAETELAFLLAEEAALRSPSWVKAHPHEKGSILQDIQNEFINTPNLLSHEDWGEMVKKKSNHVEHYLRIKNSLIQDLNNFIYLKEKKSPVQAFFNMKMEPELEMRIAASKTLVHSLMYNQPLNLTQSQLNNLLKQDSYTKGVLERYYSYKMENLLPKLITDTLDQRNNQSPDFKRIR